MIGRRAVLCGPVLAMLCPPARASDWAQDGAANGVPNLHRVTDSLWRSGQPRAEGFSFMADLGVRSVISLRHGSRDERRTSDARLDLVSVPMTSRNVAADDGAQVVQALRALDAGLQRGPVLVHCRFGSDRTGCIVALYRMLWQDWPRAKAITEMTGGPYGFHAVYRNIPDYLETVDLNVLRARIRE